MSRREDAFMNLRGTWYAPHLLFCFVVGGVVFAVRTRVTALNNQEEDKRSRRGGRVGKTQNLFAFSVPSGAVRGGG